MTKSNRLIASMLLSAFFMFLSFASFAGELEQVVSNPQQKKVKYEQGCGNYKN